jgi:hypothetical protein
VENKYEGQMFSLNSLKCTHCGSAEFQPKGIKGYILRSIMQQFLLFFLFRANENGPFEFKCLQCGVKFIGLPKEAEVDEFLESPCTIKLTRGNSILGAVFKFSVFLNGKKTASIGNGKTIEIKTVLKNNLLFLTDYSGRAFSKYFIIDAVAGGFKELNWKLR